MQLMQRVSCRVPCECSRRSVRTAACAPPNAWVPLKLRSLSACAHNGVSLITMPSPWLAQVASEAMPSPCIVHATSEPHVCHRVLPGGVAGQVAAEITWRERWALTAGCELWVVGRRRRKRPWRSAARFASTVALVDAAIASINQ